MDPILLLKIGNEDGFIEIYQEGEDFVYHSDDTKVDKRQSFLSFEEALSQVDLRFLKHGVITYINPENEFDIKLKIHERVKHL